MLILGLVTPAPDSECKAAEEEPLVTPSHSCGGNRGQRRQATCQRQPSPHHRTTAELKLCPRDNPTVIREENRTQLFPSPFPGLRGFWWSESGGCSATALWGGGPARTHQLSWSQPHDHLVTLQQPRELKGCLMRAPPGEPQPWPGPPDFSRFWPPGDMQNSEMVQETSSSGAQTSRMAPHV